MKSHKERLINLIDDIKEEVITGQCGDDEIFEIVDTILKERKGYINPEDIMTADDAMRFLNIHSRNKFFDLMKMKKISPVVINNRKCGYRKREIEKCLDK